jgi:hypothetical protein
MSAKRPGANGNRGETTHGVNGIQVETTRIQKKIWRKKITWIINLQIVHFTW